MDGIFGRGGTHVTAAEIESVLRCGSFLEGRVVRGQEIGPRDPLDNAVGADGLDGGAKPDIREGMMLLTGDGDVDGIAEKGKGAQK